MDSDFRGSRLRLIKSVFQIIVQMEYTFVLKRYVVGKILVSRSHASNLLVIFFVATVAIATVPTILLLLLSK